MKDKYGGLGDRVLSALNAAQCAWRGVLATFGLDGWQITI